MSGYRLADAALNDLSEIWLHISIHNVSAADRWISILRDKCQLLAEYPGLGRTRDDIAARVRTFPVGHYLLIYQPANEGIEVVRILHGAQRIDALLRG